MGNYFTTNHLEKNKGNKGNHIFADFTGFKGDENYLGKYIFDLMIKAIERTEMKIIHRHLKILNINTPPGFTSVLLLDSSHFTSHCYSDEGILAMDLFTCGPTNTYEVMEFVKKELIKEFPEIKCTYLENHKRFNY